MFRSKCALVVIFASVSSLTALAAESNGITFGGYVDSYYAYDFDRPPTTDRQFTTQPSRHNEFNINLAHIEGKLERDRVHGRIALQAGTSVQSNYAGEPSIGSVSGPSLSRNIQEAYAGYRLGTDTWIDAGIMFSHIGLESFISKDNLTYTRSLVVDYSPFYQTGVRLSTKFTERLSAQLLILNGWQNISETNAQKALGTLLNYMVSPSLSVTYNTFIGNESSLRHFHDLVLRYSPSDLWTLALQADLGFQADSPGGKNANWSGFTLIAKHSFSKTLSLVGRVERFEDPQQVMIAASNGHAFRSWGASLGADCTLDQNVMWRNEVRTLSSDQPVFTAHNGPTRSDTLVVSSLSVAF